MSADTVSLAALKWGAATLFALAAAFGVFGIAQNRQSLPYRYWALYVAYLERSLRSMFIMTPGHYIALAQLAGIGLGIGLGVSTRDPLGYSLIPLSMVGPILVIRHLRRRRMKRIESKLDGFILALANAL